MYKNPRCPKCGGRLVCIGFGTRMEIEYKCQTKGCRATSILNEKSMRTIKVDRYGKEISYG